MKRILKIISILSIMLLISINFVYAVDMNLTENTSSENFLQEESANSSTSSTEFDDESTISTSTTVKFTNTKNWTKVYAYFFNSKGTVGTAWPGTKMTSLGKNSYNESIYEVKIPSGATHVIFTNGSKQTVDITLTGAEGYYISGTASSGKFNVKTW